MHKDGVSAGSASSRLEDWIGSLQSHLREFVPESEQPLSRHEQWLVSRRPHHFAGRYQSPGVIGLLGDLVGYRCAFNDRPAEYRNFLNRWVDRQLFGGFGSLVFSSYSSSRQTDILRSVGMKSTTFTWWSILVNLPLDIPKLYGFSVALHATEGIADPISAAGGLAGLGLGVWGAIETGYNARRAWVALKEKRPLPSISPINLAGSACAKSVELAIPHVYRSLRALRRGAVATSSYVLRSLQSYQSPWEG